MRIFKNRGDIYFSKVNKVQSAEQKILLIGLACTVIITVVFLIVLGIKNDFSAKKFFAPENTTIKSAEETQEQEKLPEVKGKTNFITAVYDDETLLFAYVVQTDMDAKAYKVCSLKALTEAQGNNLDKIFAQSGIVNLKNAVESELGITSDYYIGIDKKNMEEIFDDMGSINYPILNDIKYSGDKDNSSYSIKINSGEQKISGKQFINLIRYYLEQEDNPSMANDLILAAFSQLINSENHAKSDDIFKKFSAYAQTNITVRDFSAASDKIEVMSSERSSMGAYNANAQYDGNKINSESLRKIKGYFVK